MQRWSSQKGLSSSQTTRHWWGSGLIRGFSRWMKSEMNWKYVVFYSIAGHEELSFKSPMGFVVIQVIMSVSTFKTTVILYVFPTITNWYDCWWSGYTVNSWIPIFMVWERKNCMSWMCKRCWCNHKLNKCPFYVKFVSASAPLTHVWTLEKKRLILIILQCE